MKAHRDFPAGFVWGTATSAAQIEGAVQAEGRGRSIWDRFAEQPGAIADGSSPAVACDHFHRWPQDLELMQWLGLSAYRFSIAWPRILPQGTGPVNAPGLDFYDRLVDRLLAADIAPFVTLYHWDLPQALQDRGGWASRGIVDAFVHYADVVTSRLGDRVASWATHNEPWCIATLGHEEGQHAPGHRDPAESLAVAHHLLLSHGRAVPVIRANAPTAEVGIVLNLVPADPLEDTPADRDAVRRFDGCFNRWYLDPLFRGRYPADAIVDRVHRGHLAIADLPFVEDGDLVEIATPLDFLGVNYYSRVVLRADEQGEPVPVVVAAPEKINDMGWEDHPRGLAVMLRRLHEEYGVQRLYVTENGGSFADEVGPDGFVDDVRRIDYMRGHLDSARRAIEAGVPLKGYFAWSLMDNFEWAHGYTKRFGLFRVDYGDQSRHPKRSAHWYRSVISANAVDAPSSAAEGRAS